MGGTTEDAVSALSSFNEMIQEGNLGLLLAAERFDERLGYRFSTFAVGLIRAKMKRESDNQGRMIRVPVYQCEAMRRLEKLRVRLEGELGREVGPSELIVEAGMKTSEFVELSALKEGVVSLHQLVSCDGETTMEQVVPDPETVTLFYDRVDLTGKLDCYLEGLEETERQVVSYLFGLAGMPHLSAEETAALLGLKSVELGRVRERALRAIRSALESSGEFDVKAA
jgi:RNA polymerase primary sigma factor